MLGNKIDFSSCAIWIGLHKSSHVCTIYIYIHSFDFYVAITLEANFQSLLPFIHLDKLHM